MVSAGGCNIELGDTIFLISIQLHTFLISIQLHTLTVELRNCQCSDVLS